MRLTRWLCVTVLLFGAAACGGGSAKSTAGGTTTSTSAPSGSSTSSGAAGSSTPSGPATSSSAAAPSSLPADSGQRVAELSSEGGFAAGGQLRLIPPAVVVYADGSVVLSARKRVVLDTAALSSLTSAIQQDLAGQPPTLQPTSGHPIPDRPTTVLGIRKADGSYQIVRANSLPELGKLGGYPAPVYDAYTKLNALTNSPNVSDFTSTSVRYVLLCPQAVNTTPKFWPDGLPDPVNGAGPNCPETHVVSGPVVAVVKSACTLYAPAEGEASQPDPYLSKKGIRTCQWRYALPDETAA